ncbi:MAG: metallophosphoesterase [Pseudomonadales bacterium]|nr:metallophosphoesterase [Pseudomonadales bacterium]
MHLLSAEKPTMLGIDTRLSLQAVLNHARQIKPDVVIATGDIAHNSIPEVYQHFSGMVAEVFDCELLCVPGNHDLDLAMFQAGLIERRLELGDWMLMGIDTHVDGEVCGYFGEQRLLALEQQLRNCHASNILVFGHHPPLSIKSGWLDSQQICNGERLLALLENDARIAAYVFGHVHQEVDIASCVQILASPSTCFQFERQVENFALSSEKPGYRVIQLGRNGEFHSKVFRLLDYELSLDLSQLAY